MTISPIFIHSSFLLEDLPLVLKVVGDSSPSPSCHRSGHNSQVTSSERPSPTSPPIWAPSHFPSHCPVFSAAQRRSVLFNTPCSSGPLLPVLPQTPHGRGFRLHGGGDLVSLFVLCPQCPARRPEHRGCRGTSVGCAGRRCGCAPQQPASWEGRPDRGRRLWN